MSYYCKECGENHDGFPDYMFAFPEEYLHMSPEDRKKKVKRVSENVIVINHGDHTHLYVHAFWLQKVQGVEERWTYKVWVMLPAHEFTRLKFLVDKMSFHGSLQSNLPWYSDTALGYPIQMHYDEEEEEMFVDAVNPANKTIEKDWKVGLSLDLALLWLHNFLQNVKTHESKYKPEI